MSSIADLVVEIAFTTDPLSTTPSWTDVSAYVRHEAGAQIHRGRPAELDEFQPGDFTCTLSNLDRRFDPDYTSGPYYPNVKPGKAIRVRGLWSGVYYTRFFGFIDSWPQEYADGKVDATVQIEAFDGLTVLSEMVQPDPVFTYTLNTIGSCALFLRNSDGNTWFDESGFGRHAYRITDVAHSATTFGSRIFRTRPKPRTTNTYIGGVGYELPSAGSDSAPSGVNGAATVSSSLAAGLTSPSVTGGLFRPSSTISLGANWSVSLWFACDLASIAGQPAPLINMINDVSRALFGADTSSNLALGDDGHGVLMGGEGAGTTGLNVADGKAHHAVITVAGTVSTLYVDGVSFASNPLGGAPATFLSIDLDTYSRATTFPFASTLLSPPVSNMVVQDITLFTKTLSAAEITGLYQRGNGQLSESTAARVSRLMAATDWPSAWVNVTTSPKGTCLDYTPAFQGTLDALSEVAATEQGRIFVDTAGVLQLHQRYQYLETTRGKTVQAIFSDDGSDIAIKQTGTDHSAREVQNDITVIATLGVSAEAQDATSVAAYRRQPATISTLLPSATEAGDMAAGLLYHRKDRRARTRGPIEVQPATKTTNWPTLLTLEIGDRIQREITPLVGPQSVLLLTIEGIEEDITVDDWVIGFHGSPVPGGAVAATTFGVWDDATFGVWDTARWGY